MESRHDPTGPSQSTIKRLFAHSGNGCAFPRCTAALIEGERTCVDKRAADAKQRAAQAKDLSAKRAFQEVAAAWLVLAERMEWIDSQKAPTPQREDNKAPRMGTLGAMR